MVANLSTINFGPISNNMVYFMRFHVLKHHNKMTLPREKNRHILEISRVLFLGVMVPSYHWGDVVATTVYLINRMPSKILHFEF